MRFRFCIVLLVLPCAAQVSGAPRPVREERPPSIDNPVAMVFESAQTQTLADGTHIHRVTHESFYRDSAGRTRSERDFDIPGRPGVFIVTVNDPVMRMNLHWMTGPTSQQQFTSLDLDAIDRTPAKQDSAQNEPRLPQLQRVAPTAAKGADSFQVKPKFERLGMQQVEGASCEATRSTTVYPVDSIGNDRPITVTAERCFSREFGRALREVSVDPRTGTRTVTLQSLRREEPAATLFQPPPDYAERSQTP